MQDRPVSAATASQAATSKRVEPVAERASSHSRRDLLRLLIPQKFSRKPASPQACFSRKLTDRVSGGKNARKRSNDAKTHIRGDRGGKSEIYSDFAAKPPFLSLKAILHAVCRKSSPKCEISATVAANVCFYAKNAHFFTKSRQTDTF
tara:strand:- start:1932 stop:2375 length:444 start_codon:yes stop_codon:yes gene_type:complete